MKNLYVVCSEIIKIFRQKILNIKNRDTFLLLWETKFKQAILVQVMSMFFWDENSFRCLIYELGYKGDSFKKATFYFTFTIAFCFLRLPFDLRQEALEHIFNNKIDSIETECIFIADLLPWNHLEKCMCITLFWLTMIRFIVTT